MATQKLVRPIIVVGSLVIDHKWYQVGRLLPFSKLQSSGGGYPLWRVELRHGGVGRNVAENLALLEVPVLFAGLSGTDNVAMEMETRLCDAGVRLAVVRVSDGIGRFDAHLDDGGQLKRSHIHFPREELLTWEMLISELPDLGNAAAVAVETGLAEPTLTMLRDYTRQRGVRLLGMPTRLADYGARWPLLKALDILVLNAFEAAAITGLPGGEPSAARAQVSKILATGPSTVVLTCGNAGVVAASADEPEPRHFPARHGPCIDDTGAGDALTAALLAALIQSADLATAVTLGIEAARITVGCPDTTCRKVSDLANNHTFHDFPSFRTQNSTGLPSGNRSNNRPIRSPYSAPFRW